MSSKSSGFLKGFALSNLFAEFFHSEKFSGFLLIGCTAISLGIANSSWGPAYAELWHVSLGGMSFSHFINDALMAIFFLLVGLEIEREIYVGELSKFRQAILPIIAAIGGMVVPAGLHLLLNQGTPTASGAGIPMATDIAFALGILSLAGKAVPPALKVFLAALAIIDDLGAILVIAIFYSTGVSFTYLGAALAIFLLLFVAGKRGVTNLWFFLVPGVVLWYCMYRSGIHATISGVLLAFAIPFGKGGDESASAKLQRFLHPLVGYIIVPLFALANTGILLEAGLTQTLVSLNSLGIMAGLVIGKPVGIFIFSWLSVQLKMASLPQQVNWKHILAAGMLGGIGFTMSIFITLLAFPNEPTVVSSKIAILLASLMAALGGLLTFRIIR